MAIVTPFMLVLAQQVDVNRILAAAAAIVGFICALVASLVIGLVAGGAMLWAAFNLYNALVNQPRNRNRVRIPGFPKLMGIAAATLVVNAVISAMISFAIGVGTAVLGADNRGAVILTQLVSSVICYCVLTGLLRALVPLSLDRAALIALLFYAISIIVVVAIVLLLLAAIGGVPVTPP